MVAKQRPARNARPSITMVNVSQQTSLLKSSFATKVGRLALTVRLSSKSTKDATTSRRSIRINVPYQILTHCRCRCSHQFCYICGATWKTCQCQQWTDRNLQRVLNAENGNEPLPPQEARCYRHDWIARVGRRRCEGCGRNREHYTCRNCPGISCRECRYPAGNYGIWH
jgi:hypothetical protein